jgi:hypothetical protein
MKKKFLYNALIILALTACTEQDIIEQPSTPNGGTEVRLPADVNSGELLIKFKPEMTDILDRTMTRATGSGGAITRSGIPSTDEVLEILGGYHFERIFPIDSKNEERTRIAGLHLWYQVKFDEDTDLQEAAKRLSALGEISKVQGNQRIKRAYDVKTRRSYISRPPCNSGLPPVAEYRLEDFRTPDFPINGITSTPVKTLSTSRTTQAKSSPGRPPDAIPVAMKHGRNAQAIRPLSLPYWTTA